MYQPSQPPTASTRAISHRTLTRTRGSFMAVAPGGLTYRNGLWNTFYAPRRSRGLSGRFQLWFTRGALDHGLASVYAAQPLPWLANPGGMSPDIMITSGIGP